ncbi:hypothetical protein FKM82_025634 [Ascaphus truei]
MLCGIEVDCIHMESMRGWRRGARYNTHHCEMLKELDWPSLESRLKVHLSCLAFKFFMGKLPSYLNKLLTPTTCSTYHL